MADQFLPMAFYWQGKKAAETNAVDVEFNNGREKLIGQEGIIAYSRGIATMTVTITEVVPIAGSTTTKDLPKILAQEDIDVGIILGDKMLRNKMAVLKASYKSNIEKGVIEGSITLEGAKPTIV